MPISSSLAIAGLGGLCGRAFASLPVKRRWQAWVAELATSFPISHLPSSAPYPSTLYHCPGTRHHPSGTTSLAGKGDFFGCPGMSSNSFLLLGNPHLHLEL